jgi:hypothetical protein
LKVDREGAVSELAELPGRNNAHLIYDNGLLYIVARGVHQIYAVALDGELTLLAGSGQRGHADGPADEATFSLPNDIVMAADGRRLFVNEVAPINGTANLPSMIRVIELPRPDSQSE